MVEALLAPAPGQLAQSQTFLEMGGGDGITLSNTFFLEACLGWRGILIEANPSLSRAICRRRPCALAFAFAACELGQLDVAFSVPLKFRSGPPPNGGKDFRRCGNVPVPKCTKVVSTPRGWSRGYYVEQWVTGAATPTRNHETTATTYAQQIRVPCARLSTILTTAQVSHIDYLSLDVEGAEAVALRTIDWGRLSIHLVQVEQSGSALDKNDEVRNILWGHGFVHVATIWVWERHLADEFFLNGTYLQNNLVQVVEAVGLPKNVRFKLRQASPAAARRILEKAARKPQLFRRLDAY